MLDLFKLPVLIYWSQEPRYLLEGTKYLYVKYLSRWIYLDLECDLEVVSPAYVAHLYCINFEY